MAVKVTVTFEGLGEVLNRLTEIDEKAQKNVETITENFGKDTESFWKDITHQGKTGRLRDEEKVEPMGLTFVMTSPTYYYKFVDEGHKTPEGWHRHRRDGSTYFQQAKRRSVVKGQEMTKRTTDFIEQNLEKRYSKFLDNM